MNQTHRIVIALVAAAVLAGYAPALAELITALLRYAALFFIVAVAFWIMVVLPFRNH